MTAHLRREEDMFGYYTSVLILCGITLAAMSILVHENGRISNEDKRLMYLTYVLVAVSAFAEWCGVQLDGRADMPAWIIKAVKCADYIFTPMSGVALVLQIRFKSHPKIIMYVVIIANTILQLVSAPFGWMVEIDAQNHYSHGPLYPIYFGVCLMIIVLMIMQFILYGKNFKRQNRISLYTIMFLVVAGIAMQELPSGSRTAYIGMTIGAVLLFIHYTEFAHLATDDKMSEQRIQLMLSQIKPHFLYNTLGSIEALCERDPKVAKLATRNFSKYLRGNMDSLSGENLIPFEKELQHTKLYLGMEMMRFGDALTVEYDIAKQNFFIPPLTLEPIVENAVKHGIRRNENGRGIVRIATRERGDGYEILVSDNGPGFHPMETTEDPKRIGIRNVRERLKRICGGSLQIDSKEGEGTTVTIHL